jgi:uncharacterized protein (TIGR02597 family)
MKTYTYSLLLAAAASGMAFGAQTAYTIPVGYVALGDDTVGQPAIKATTDVAVSIPLVRSTEFAGGVSATTSNTITVSGTPAWTTGPSQWAPSASTPYVVSVTSGAQSGFTGLITSNTVDTLTVTPVTAGSLAGVLAGDKVKIYKAWTLISLFPSGTFPAGVRVFGFSGIAPGINLPADLNFLWNGTSWTKSGSPANDTIFYPGESFFIRTITTQVASLTISGEVPTANSRTYIDKISAGVAQDSRLGYTGPVDELIGNSSLSATLTAGDRLLGFNNNAAGINKPATDNVLWNGTNWTIGGSPVSGSYALKGGKGYIVRRLASAPVGATDWKDQQTYIPSL